MRKRITAQNLKWTCGWLAVAGLALCWWLPLPLHPAADSGPPWIYGNPEARFTVTLYTNLECPHCRFYLPNCSAGSSPTITSTWPGPICRCHKTSLHPVAKRGCSNA